MPPSFESNGYWEDRFAKSQAPFDWLASADESSTIVEEIIQATRGATNEQPAILHIGCGTSDLSLRLRSCVQRPAQVHNVDFSQRAVELSRQREKDLFANVDTDQRRDKRAPTESKWMQWSNIDLLSLPSILALAKNQESLYTFIIDKSTSDSIACGEQVSFTALTHVGKPCAPILMDPVEVLALHLAAATVPGARWIVISYSADRFMFLGDKTTKSDGEGNMPKPTDFWQLERKEELIIAGTGNESHAFLSNSTVHRPQIHNWLYVITRTNALSWTRHFNPSSGLGPEP